MRGAAAALLLAIGGQAAAGTAPAAEPAPLQLPRASLEAADLGLLVADGDPLSEAAAAAYARARGIPAANILVLKLPPGVGDAISDSDFAGLKAEIDARMPARVQALLATWLRPSRVQGAGCAMGITSALAWGYNPSFCGGCQRTRASDYFDSETTHPWRDLRIRPAMLLGATTPEAAQALIARGLAAEASQPAGTGWAVRTADAARSVRWPELQALPRLFGQPGAPALRYLDASDPAQPQELADLGEVLFYFTGLARLEKLASLRFVPGALADHLTSSGGRLPDGAGQTTALAWLQAGASASYGTVEEPCNHPQKFPRPALLVEHYLRGATALEAYWKSVAWPGQGLFVGDPLARPWAHQPQALLEGGSLVIHTRSLRRGARYRVEWQAPGTEAWQLLAERIGPPPQALAWRIALPPDAAAGRLRWQGPCPLQPAWTCTLAGG